MRLGIFGGTFNPIHNGHLINAMFIKRHYSLNKILFIPSKYPVHKNLEGNINPEDRYEMIKLAIKGVAEFDAARIEIDRKEKSFTIITIRQLLDVYPCADINLIIGADAFNEIDTWKDYRELIQLVSFIVIKRNGTIKLKKNILKTVKSAFFPDNPIIEISSSEIRENIKKGFPIKYLLPQSVEKYILDKELYRN